MQPPHPAEGVAASRCNPPLENSGGCPAHCGGLRSAAAAQSRDHVPMALAAQGHIGANRQGRAIAGAPATVQTLALAGAAGCSPALHQTLPLPPFQPPDPITAGKAFLTRSQLQLALSRNGRPNQQRQQERTTATEHPEPVRLQGLHWSSITLSSAQQRSTRVRLQIGINHPVPTQTHCRKPTEPLLASACRSHDAVLALPGINCLLALQCAGSSPSSAAPGKSAEPCSSRPSRPHSQPLPRSAAASILKGSHHRIRRL